MARTDAEAAPRPQTGRGPSTGWPQNAVEQWGANPMHILAQTAYAILSMPCLLITLGAPPTRRAWAKDLLGRYCWANANFASDLGLQPDALCGRPTEELWPQCWREIARVDRHVIENRAEVVAHSEELEFPAGAVLVAVTRVPLVDEKGVVVGVAGFYDAPACTARGCAEQQLRLSLFSDEQLERYVDGLEAMAEEFSA